MENLLVDIDFRRKPFPLEFPCDSNDRSPGIRIGRIHAKYLAIILEEVTGSTEMFTHWLIWNIRARDTVPEGIPPEPVTVHPFSAIQGTNDFGTIGYQAPRSAAGGGNRYYLNVYGLDDVLDIPPGSDRRTLINAMKGHLVQYGCRAIPVAAGRYPSGKIPDPGSPC
ncbi:MAG TPA: YbhB/YbcL family Raf kinase inhibitor-like protein [Methanoregula sp.]|nr:YbhB/YbcL family Raf kinase inhibitor-like protein [Methanoregula sp.]